METYEKLLQKAVDKLPKQKSGGERFEIPRIDVFIQGNQTIIKNFSDICGKIRRDEKVLLKYLSRALASPGSVVNGRAIFQSKLIGRIIQNKLEVYIRDYVTCIACKRPDTRLTKEGKVMIMKCHACGARNTIK
jgi:translation initiation factor 2 subunit 2